MQLKLKYCTKFVSGNGFAEELQGSSSGDIPFMKVSDINGDDRFVERANNYVSYTDVTLRSWNVIPRHSVLMAKIGAALAKNHRKVLKRDAIIDNNMMAVIPLNVEDGYFYWLWKTIDLSDFQNISSVPSINMEQLKNHTVDIPEIDDQKKIAAYLDQKTATIDKMIIAKNHTHTHLLELRAAIITNTIFGRGGSAMSYRQTNIPWIGKIPSHWKVEKIKGVADIVLGKMLQTTEKEGYQYKKYLRAQNIRWERVDVSDVNEMWFSPNELSVYRLKEGDILVSEGGEVGRAAMWHGELDECYIQNSVNRLRVNKDKIDSRYLLYVLEGFGQSKVFENTVNRVSIAHLTREKLKEYSIPLPPLDEQREIVKNIEESLQKIDRSVEGLQKSTELLMEYRSSLISNVVGGKVEI